MRFPPFLLWKWDLPSQEEIKSEMSNSPLLRSGYPVFNSDKHPHPTPTFGGAIQSKPDENHLHSRGFISTHIPNAVFPPRPNANSNFIFWKSRGKVDLRLQKPNPCGVILFHPSLMKRLWNSLVPFVSNHRWNKWSLSLVLINNLTRVRQWAA